jgi:hypothetical protein
MYVLPLNMSILQQTKLFLKMSDLQQPVLPVGVCFTAACGAPPVHVCLQELLGCIWKFLSTRACAASWRWIGGTFLWFFRFFQFFLKRFPVFFVSIVRLSSETLKQTEKNVFWFCETNRKEP